MLSPSPVMMQEIPHLTNLISKTVNHDHSQFFKIQRIWCLITIKPDSEINHRMKEATINTSLVDRIHMFWSGSSFRNSELRLGIPNMFSSTSTIYPIRRDYESH